MNLKGKWSLITGASSGLGWEYALQLSHLESNTILIARRGDRLSALKKEILTHNSKLKVEVLEIDLTEKGQSKKIMEAIKEKGLQVSILINNAGLGSYASFSSSPWKIQEEMILINIMALTELTHSFISHMKDHQLPSFITNISSIAAYIQPPKFSTYNGTKSYVKSFSLTLSEELRKTNIHVYCLSPGGVKTEFSQRSGQELTKSANMAMMEAKDVVKEALKDMFKKKVSSMPGLFNKLTILLPRLLPEGILIKMSSLIFGSMVKSKEKPDLIS